MFQSIDPKQLQENVFSLIGDQWTLITAGTPDHYDRQLGRPGCAVA